MSREEFIESLLYDRHYSRHFIWLLTFVLMPSLKVTSVIILQGFFETIYS